MSTALRVLQVCEIVIFITSTSIKLVDILQGLKLMKRCGPCYIYVGPNAFAAWEDDQVAAFGSGIKIRHCNVTVPHYKVPKHLWYGRARMRMKRYMKGQGRV